MPTAGVTSPGPLMSGYFFLSISSTFRPTGDWLPKKLYVCTNTTSLAFGPASSVKRPPAGPQCDTIGTFQPMRSSDFTTCADGPTLPTSISESAPAAFRRDSCGVTSTSFGSNFSTPAGFTPFALSAATRPFWLDSPHGLLTTMTPGVFVL